MNRALACATIMLGLAMVGSASQPSRAAGPDRLPQMTVLIEDAANIASEIATCRSSAIPGLSPKRRQEVETALRGAGLEEPQIADLLRRLESFKPLIGDDRPIAEALLFCDSRTREEKRARDDRFFRLAERITNAAATPAGRDDALIRDEVEKIMPNLKLAKTCMRLENGPFPKSKGIDPRSTIGKELVRFDISATMREHLDRVFMDESYFDNMQTVGDLRAICTERARAIEKTFKETGEFPTGADSLKAVQPTR